ncbi:lysozyme inhibitor LprI family protein [Psychrobacter sp. H7-1]|uniref:lysozyme inhibitor LprI family protein n=1 Tax=Psychrobacter sp. H7-1 TaxID=1569265 RepID=UPI001918FDBC|nr:lysozyme inhibitor LprI family protein [Psychrobacter sp. H7-1]
MVFQTLFNRAFSAHSALAATPLILVTLLASTHAMASEEYCNGKYDQASMNQCAQSDYKDEDAKLNSAYKTLRSLLNTEEKDQLKQVQLAWISYRDKVCDFENRNEKGGSIYPLLTSSCLKKHTEVRRKQIEGEINWIQETQH